MARDLRKRVTLAIIIPLFLGMLIIISVTCIPLYIVYSDYVDSYDSHMIKYEKHIMTELDKVIAIRESVGMLWLGASFAELSSELITNFYYGRIQKTENWNGTTIYDYSTGYSQNDSIGICQSATRDAQSDVQYLNSSIFYYFMQPLIKIGERFTKNINYSHVTFKDGFFAMFPYDLNLFNAFANTGNGKYMNQSQFWNATSPNQKLNFIITNGTFTMVCRPLVLPDKSIGTLPCVGLSLDSVPIIKYSDREQLIVVDENYNIYYPKSKRGKDFCETYLDFNCSYCRNNSVLPYEPQGTNERFLEIKPNSEICDVSKAIKNHTNHINTIIKYKLSDHTYVTTVSPMNISLPLIQDSSQTFSSILTTKQKHMSKKFITLTKKLGETITIQIAVIGSVLIVMVLAIGLISYKITSSVIAPIDSLYAILKRLHTDLGVNVKSHQQKGPPEVTDLYEVFDRLRLILRFEDAQLFKDPTYAMMNYAQALKLFHSFNNKRAMEKCFQEIGNIHMSHERFLEAAMNYHCSLLISQEIGSPETEIAAKQIKTAIAMLKAKVKPQRAKNLFYEALNLYSNQPIFMKLPVYLDLIECLLINQDLVANEMAKAEEYISILNEQNIDQILLQKFQYLQALQAYNKSQYRKAAELCTEVLENYEETHRGTRKKCLKILKKIFKKFEMPYGQIEVLQKALETGPKDIMVVIEKKLGEEINEQLIHELVDSVFEEDDRISFIQFDDTTSIVYNLTGFPKRRCSSSNIFVNQNKCLMLDAIHLALTQISTINSFIPQSFLSKEIARKEWILVITYGEDYGSSASYEKLAKMLRNGKANLVIILLNQSPGIFSSLEKLAKSSPFGIVIECYDFCEIQRSFLKAAAYISQGNSLFI